MSRWWILLLALGCGGTARRAPPPTAPDPVWQERVEHALASLTAESLVPGAPDEVTAAGWRALGEDPASGTLAERVGSRVAEGSLDPAKAWDVIAAMANAVDDAHTMLISPDGLTQFGASLQGSAFTAPGAVVAWTPDRDLVVTDVLAGAPAGDAGLVIGDVITAVNDTPPPRTWSLVHTTFVPVDSETRLAVLRDGEPVELAFPARPYAHPVSVHETAGGVGILRPYFFATGEDPARNAYELARTALADFDRAAVTGLVLDLRGNQGGEGVARYVSLFTDADPLLIAYVPEPEPWPNPHETTPTPRPIAVLIDEQSVSAAEMVALALQVHAHAHVVGQPSGGALNVPGPVELGDGYLLFLPMIAVGAPGTDAQLRVAPDERVPNRTVADLRAGRDPQLEAAMRWLGTQVQ